MDTGTKVYRNYFPIKFGWQAACQFGRIYPCFRKLVYPGDVFKINADLLIRYQPMLAPPMNAATATVRFGFVPLRLIEENTELIITGSKDGKLYTETLPQFDSCFKYLNFKEDHTTVEKGSIFDLLYQIPTGLTLNTQGLKDKLDASPASPALYFAKAFARFWWDYYRDENLFDEAGGNDFEAFFDNYIKEFLHREDWYGDMPLSLKKDRITSSLPWQLKAVAAPTIEITGNGTLTPNFNVDMAYTNPDGYGVDLQGIGSYGTKPFAPAEGTFDPTNFNAAFNNQLNQPQSGGVSISAGSLNGSQFRDMMSMTRVFERLARCGSRYTEYLRANFNVAPSDGTLQRAQYLGGFKTHIVTTEVVQTAAAGDNPVGTLRGHGITHGTATIKPFMAREIGVIIGILDVRPESIYAQGVDRELTARSRFDFLNPSFQHLSEQEVRNGEVYFNTDVDSDGNLNNDKTWGFQPYAQELRTGIKHVCSEMRDSLSYWNQSIIMSERPSLNQAFLNAASHRASFNRPFAVSSVDALPMVVDFGGIIEAYRPLVKNGTPGLVDHN